MEAPAELPEKVSIATLPAGTSFYAFAFFKAGYRLGELRRVIKKRSLKI